MCASLGTCLLPATKDFPPFCLWTALRQTVLSLVDKPLFIQGLPPATQDTGCCFLVPDPFSQADPLPAPRSFSCSSGNTVQFLVPACSGGLQCWDGGSEQWWGPAAPLPFSCYGWLGRGQWGGEQHRKGFLSQASRLHWERVGPLSWLSLGPLVQCSSPPLAAPAVRHGSNPYMSEQ